MTELAVLYNYLKEELTVANEIGAIIRWLLKGCKPSLEDLSSDFTENSITAMVTGLLLVLLVYLFW